jgi:hypothetical protein
MSKPSILALAVAATLCACDEELVCPQGQTACDNRCVSLLTDATNCGACGSACGAGRACSGGSCVCTGGTPLTCGTNCCAGTGCCSGGTTCQVGHSNGLGQTFYDCTASYTPSTTTPQAATAAAQAWGASTIMDGRVFCASSCVAGQKAGACAIWCFGSSPLAGRVLQTTSPSCSASACPFELTGFALWPSP